MTTLAVVIVVAFGLAAVAAGAIVLVQAKRAPRIPNYQAEFEKAADNARKAGARARDRIRRDANSQQY